jgi:hypothetical protein
MLLLHYAEGSYSFKFVRSIFDDIPSTADFDGDRSRGIDDAKEAVSHTKRLGAPGSLIYVGDEHRVLLLCI